MADQKRIVLRPLHVAPKTIYLRELPIATPSAGTKIYLRPVHASPNTIRMFAANDPGAASGFPAQFAGLRYYRGGVIDLCMVAVGDAPNGLRVKHAGVDRAIYLVATSDPNASALRIKTAAGISAIRNQT